MTIVELSIVAPCYNEESVLDAFFDTLTRELEKLAVSWEIVCVNDGSSDATRDVLVAKAREDARIKVVDLTRNFGKEAALTAGLDRAKGRAVVPIDVDLQDPPELIADMLAKWRAGFDVVYATRSARATDGFLKRTTARVFYGLFNRLTTVPIPRDAGDFRLMDRRVIDALKQLPERNRFMKGLFSWPGFKQAEVLYERRPRQQGSTKFNYWKLWNFAIDGMTSFSTAPLRVWTYVGGIVALFAFLYSLIIIVRTLIYGIDVPGYASLLVIVLFIGGVQLISLGIIGEYLGRTYNEVKRRPIYLVDHVYDFDKPSDGGVQARGRAADEVM